LLDHSSALSDPRQTWKATYTVRAPFHPLLAAMARSE